MTSPRFEYPVPASEPIEEPQLSESERQQFAQDGYLFAGLSPDREGTYRLPGFDMQAAVDEVAGPFVEVAGPTGSGYRLLQGVNFAQEPIITNFDPDQTPRVHFVDDEDNVVDTLALDALADARHLPFASESVGVLAASCVNKFSRRPRVNPVVLQGWQLGRAYRKAQKHLGDTKSPKFAAASEANPRIGLMQEAARVLKPGGLFATRAMNAEDTRLAAHFGLKPVVITPPIAIEYATTREVFPREIIFQKTEPQPTP